MILFQYKMIGIYFKHGLPSKKYIPKGKRPIAMINIHQQEYIESETKFITCTVETPSECI